MAGINEPAPTPPAGSTLKDNPPAVIIATHGNSPGGTVSDVPAKNAHK